MGDPEQGLRLARDQWRDCHIIGNGVSICWKQGFHLLETALPTIRSVLIQTLRREIPRHSFGTSVSPSQKGSLRLNSRAPPVTCFASVVLGSVVRELLAHAGTNVPVDVERRAREALQVWDAPEPLQDGTGDHSAH